MKRPTAIPLDDTSTVPAPIRAPRAFAPDDAEVAPIVETLSDAEAEGETAPIRLGKPNWLLRLLWTTAGILVSLGLGLAADALIRDLFATQPWLGWLGLTVLALFLLALIVVILREVG